LIQNADQKNIKNKNTKFMWLSIVDLSALESYPNKEYLIIYSLERIFNLNIDNIQ